MPDFVGIDITGAKELEAKLAKLPQAAKDGGADEANAYLLDVLRIYPPYRYVSLAEANPKTITIDYGPHAGKQVQGYVSSKQYYWVMLNVHGVYHRTQGTRRGWKKLGEGATAILVNESKAAPFLYGDATQTRGHMLRGWDTLGYTVRERMEQIIRKFDAGVSKAIKKLGL